MTLGRLGYDERSFIPAAAFSSDGGRDSPRKLYEIVVHYFAHVIAALSSFRTQQFFFC